MKTLLKRLRLAAALATGLFVTSAYAALDVEFYVPHNTGTSVSVYAVVDMTDVGNGGIGYPTGLASYLTAFANWGNYPSGDADARATVDSTAATGRYYIGYYYGGMDAYLTIY